jgi:hypothetical protein
MIHMFLGLPNRDPLVRDKDPDPATDPDPLSSSKNSKKNINFYCFVTSLRLFIFKKDVNVPSKSNKQKTYVDVLKVTDENSRIRIH